MQAPSTILGQQGEGNFLFNLWCLMRKIAVFVLHALIAMLASVALGGVLSGIVSLMLSPVGPRHWVLFRLTTDGPYSPFFWGTGVLLGFFVNRRMRNASAQWVWVAGICWLSVWIWDAVRTYDPRWCQDCSVLQNVWRKLFTVGIQFLYAGLSGRSIWYNADGNFNCIFAWCFFWLEITRHVGSNRR